MLHDYRYICAENINDRVEADWLYAKEMEQGKIHPVTAYGRGVLLISINKIGLYNLYKL